MDDIKFILIISISSITFLSLYYTVLANPEYFGTFLKLCTKYFWVLVEVDIFVIKITMTFIMRLFHLTAQSRFSDNFLSYRLKMILTNTFFLISFLIENLSILCIQKPVKKIPEKKVVDQIFDPINRPWWYELLSLSEQELVSLPEEEIRKFLPTISPANSPSQREEIGRPINDNMIFNNSIIEIYNKIFMKKKQNSNSDIKSNKIYVDPITYDNNINVKKRIIIECKISGYNVLLTKETKKLCIKWKSNSLF